MFRFYQFSFQLIHMYRKKWPFSERACLEPNYDYTETKSSSSILFKASPKKPREKNSSPYPQRVVP